jgi:hypothetical protein
MDGEGDTGSDRVTCPTGDVPISNVAGSKNAFAAWVQGSAFPTDNAILAGPVTVKVSNASAK